MSTTRTTKITEETTSPSSIATSIATRSTASIPATGGSNAASSDTTGSGAPLLNAASSTSKRYSPGAVAGITLGVGIAVALLAALITYIFMRRQHSARWRRDAQNATQHELSKTNSGRRRKKLPSRVVDDYLPQPADDKTVQTRTKTIFDQIELFVENFCQSKLSSGAGEVSAELSAFDSPNLSKPLVSSLPRVKDAHSLIKHSLVHFIMCQISPATATEKTLLPADLALLFDATNVNARKAGLSECLSCWRVVTAYIRPDPSTDRLYVADRDRNIVQFVQQFMRAFAPWMNPKYSEQDRVQALTTIFQTAAELGIFLWAQPSEMIFQWPEENQSDFGRLAITPALVKLTDEHGHKLGQAQVLVNALMARL